MSQLACYIMTAVEIPLVPVVAAMEEVGYPVDAEYFRNLKIELQPKLEKIRDQVQAIAGPTFNPSSTPQVQKLLFDKLGLPVHERTVTKQPATDGETLKKLAGTHPVVPLLLRFRELHRIVSTYCVIADKVDADGRLYVQFNQLAAQTGRFSSSSVIQTLPKNDEFGIRRGFRASAGHTIVAADFVQQELSILAQVSGDRNMLAALRGGVDLHGLAAVNVFHLDCQPNEVKTKHPEKRDAVKAVQFGLLYGKTAFGLAKDLGISEDEADSLIKAYFAGFPAVERLITKTHEAVGRDGFIDDVFGRRRQLPDACKAAPRKKYGSWTLADKSVIGLVKAAKREAQNLIIQGAAASITKLAMIRCHSFIEANHPTIRLILQLHDELQFEVPDELVGTFAAVLPGLMCNLGIERFGFSVPLQVEVKTGPSWGDLKLWEASHAEQQT